MIKIYDQSMHLQAYLENAYDISYEERLNELWVASFSLPATDPKLAECLPLRFVEIFDGDERVDLFRIVPTKTQRGGDGSTVTFECEHVLATLLDDVLFQYHQIGGSEIPTADVIEYILSKQATPRWQLGIVAFDRQFEYKFENDNLLGACFAVPKPFDEPFQWSWDTTTAPWTLNLVEPDNGVSAYIRYGKNLIGITREEDPTQLITRIYPLGYGEGVNQLGIASVNPTGLPYIDADTQSAYGVVSYVWADLRYEYADTLFAAAQAKLEQYKTPKLTYTVDGAELYRLTNDPIDRFRSGAIVRILDEELGIDVEARVVVRSRPDVYGAPGEVRLQIANKSNGIGDDVAELDARQRVNEVTAQGATNIDSHDFADNCDPQNPAILKVYIPDETVRINKMTLSYEVSEFRAYSKSALDGGGETVSTATIAGHDTRDSGAIIDDAGDVMTGAIKLSDVSGGGDMVIPVEGTSASFLTELAGEHTHSVFSSGTHNHGGAAASHNHGNLDNANTAPAIFSDGSHGHDMSAAPEHVHFGVFEHTHVVKYHSHKIDHSHTIDLPDHTHELEYGIFLRTQTPTDVQIIVDGTPIPGADSTSGLDIDLVPFLSKDEGGKILRGAWHEIKITPNDLGRVTANIVKQIFVQSRGGGNY